jgi:DNA-binding MarR family transcriptional regulator
MVKSLRPPPASPPLEQFLCFALYSANHALHRVYKPLLDGVGLTYPQYLVMVALWAEDDRTVSQLGQQLLLESSTLTPLLKRLEALGHLTRNRDPRDERQVRLRLTPQGRALQATASTIPACVLSASGLDLAGLDRLREEIERLREALLDNAKAARARGAVPSSPASGEE